MEVLVISDVHANLVALEAVLADAGTPDAVVCAGDVVGYNPWPSECVDTVREWADVAIGGNHDRMLASGGNFGANPMAQAGIRHARRECSDDQVRWLDGLPDSRTAFDGRLTVVHGHPDDPDRYTYPEDFTPDMLGEADVLVLGHTHVQGVERYDEGVVLNPGSVGQPRDGDPRAAYALVDLASMDVSLERVPYDVDRVVDAIAAAALPARTGERLREGR